MKCTYKPFARIFKFSFSRCFQQTNYYHVYGQNSGRQNRTEPSSSTQINISHGFNSKRTGFYTYREEGGNRNRVDLVKQDKLGINRNNRDRRQTGRRTQWLREKAHNFLTRAHAQERLQEITVLYLNKGS